jgi:molybdate transport system ATP-binding protein
MTSVADSGLLAASISKHFPADGGPGFALRVDISIPAGITILFGRSGSGKTTLLQSIAGLLRPDAGRIMVGQRVLFDSAAGVNTAIQRRAVAYVLQNLALFPHLTVEENVQYGLATLSRAERRQRALSVLESFRIAHLLKRKPREISGGESQRVALARSLVTDPCLLLLDEPLAALDLPTQQRLMDDLRAWNASHRIPILYVTHSQREVFALGERVIVLENGRVLAQGAPQDVLRAPRGETIAQLAGFENIFDGGVIAVHESQGTMTCRLAGTQVELEVPLVRTSVGAPVRIAIAAGDILVATERPRSLSARNVLAGRIVSLEQQGVTVLAEVDCGLPFHVKLTPTARDSLRLALGREVWLVIKTYSCHLLQPSVSEHLSP